MTEKALNREEQPTTTHGVLVSRAKPSTDTAANTMPPHSSRRLPYTSMYCRDAALPGRLASANMKEAAYGLLMPTSANRVDIQVAIP